VQPNAYVSYNSIDNEVQVEWNFTTGGNDAPDTCLLKGDFWYYTDLDNDFNVNSADNLNPLHADYQTYTKIFGFTPIHYSVVSSNPVTTSAGSAEIIPCQGSTRIDIDRVMSNSLNDIDHKDLQIFLSFYTVNGNSPETLETFDFQSDTYVDQIFVMYTPDVSWSTGAKNYACNGEPGNVLYIDQSGAHGNNGDNCNQYVEIQSNEWVDIGGANNAAALNDGVIAKGFHNEPFFSLLIQVVENIIAIVNGGGDDDHNSRPTFGLDHKTNVQLVDEGLVINDKVHLVTDNFYTPMDMLHLQVGVTQNFTSTVYAPHTLYIMEFGFGIPAVGDWNEREASFDILTNYDGDELGVEFHQDEVSPIINEDSVVYSVSKVKCNANDNTAPCYRVSVEFSFMEGPIGNVFGLQAIDQDRKNQILYFNDGITLEGDSQNPPTVQQIISDIKYKGLQTIQRIDKENDVWITLDKSEPVSHYLRNGHGTFIPLEYRQVDPSYDEVQMNMDRLNSNFNDIKQYETKRATKIFDSQLIQGEDPTSWSYVYPPQVDRMLELQQELNDEAVRAQLEKVLSTYK
jgi:hypothetical protein